MEQEHESRVSHLKSVLDQKQKELDRITSKMQLPEDQGIMRMRIQKELENKYRFEIDVKTLELDKINDNLLETKRLYELQKTQLESQKIEYDKVIQDMKRRHQDEINELVSDNHTLQLRIEDSGKDREVQRQLRRDNEDFKRRINESQSEVLDLRKERDSLKIERNEQLIKNAKEVEEERNHRRVL
mmetsp:Transcript_6606/g.10623  ORF Transcript_6606/g.10623 Transcript_6606/m.10623 type:complete len:186 (-) Transcript_6606:907-1464(-)